jgi:putative ATP-dependent endonuclease of OLD family
VTVTIAEGERDVPLAEQSDGIRALSVLTLLSMSHKTAKIVAVDEPETHLHPTAQRSIARTLRDSGGQRILVTHSAAIAGEMDPLDIVAFRADRQARQLPLSAPIAKLEKTVRHWTHNLIEPLTA